VEQRLLLHACCAPDATVPLADLSAEGYAVTLYWYGANIHPAGEEEKRREALASLSGGNVPVIVEDAFTPPWMEAASSLAGEPEGGRRCALCFRLQLEGAARAAVREGISLLCTTLTISPHKDAGLINAIGEETARTFGLRWLFRIFRKQNGFVRSVAMSKELGLYRQSYCGCIFSLRRGEAHESVSGGETSPGSA
jgi:predicted adenine nucleotide alpha hydrolase (AANH) superfamily ATPase